jgi:16S rRNA (guanine527-N7)-methyltransferase
MLIDSIGKKVNAVKQIITSLGIDNTDCLQVRAENYPSRTRYVVSRAVTNLERFVDWVKQKIEPPSGTSSRNGIYYLKGGDLQKELRTFENITVHPLGEIFTEPFFETKKLLYLPYHSLH